MASPCSNGAIVPWRELQQRQDFLLRHNSTCSSRRHSLPLTCSDDEYYTSDSEDSDPTDKPRLQENCTAVAVGDFREDVPNGWGEDVPDGPGEDDTATYLSSNSNLLHGSSRDDQSNNIVFDGGMRCST